jgi:tryptophan synthase beta subunit
MSPNEIMIVNLSGRGDKDVNTVQDELGKNLVSN